MRRIYWDTMLFAYWFEDANRSDRVQQVYETMQRRGDLLCSSLYVLGELLVGPLRTGDAEACSLMEQFFYSPAVSLLPFSATGVRLFAQLRAQQGIKSLDALHLATAASHSVDLFLTNDRRLHSAVVPGLAFITHLDTDLL